MLIINILIIYGFNPRTRKGCDLILNNKLFICKVSIHAPVKDATVHLVICMLVLLVSIHAPVKDATVALIIMTLLLMFQSTHP